MNDCSVATTPPSSAGSVAVIFGAGLVVSTGWRHRPDATAAATDAICSGLARMRPCPIAEAASSARSLGFGNVPSYDGTPIDHFVPNPKRAAAFGRFSDGSLSAKPMNALLQEIWNAPARLSAPPDSPSKLWNTRPSTVMAGGHGAGVDPLLPAMSSAADVITLNVEPGGQPPSNARSNPPSGFETTARF